MAKRLQPKTSPTLFPWRDPHRKVVLNDDAKQAWLFRAEKQCGAALHRLGVERPADDLTSPKFIDERVKDHQCRDDVSEAFAVETPKKTLITHPEHFFLIAGARCTFGERLRLVRMVSRLDQKALAAELNVADSLISQYEGNHRENECSSERCRILAGVLQVSHPWLSGQLDDDDRLIAMYPAFLRPFVKAIEACQAWWESHSLRAYVEGLSLGASDDHELVAFFLRQLPQDGLSSSAGGYLRYWPWSLPALRRSLTIERPCRLELSVEERDLLRYLIEQHRAPILEPLAKRFASNLRGWKRRRSGRAIRPP